uniref:Uncharacterized protein n=1 Tax=Parascaris univalens TaxID=6257 RepID=A0A915CCE8_PARUN
MLLTEANFSFCIWHYLQLTASMHVFELHLATLTALQSLVPHLLHFLFIFQCNGLLL